MKLIIIVVFSLLLSRCSSSHVEASKKSNVTLLSMLQANQNDSLKKNSFQVEILYCGITEGLFKFSFSIKNNSPDTVTISPFLFYYKPTYFKVDSLDDKHQLIVQSIAPEKEIYKLNQIKTSLSTKVNPYSLNNKSVGAIAKEGLVSGTIATIFGQKVEDVESQRQEDEYEWNKSHNNNIIEVNRQISFWHNNELKQTNLSPNNNVDGTVFFPIVQNVNEVEIILPISNNYFTFRYKQVN